jgi:hypothetical protein
MYVVKPCPCGGTAKEIRSDTMAAREVLRGAQPTQVRNLWYLRAKQHQAEPVAGAPGLSRPCLVRLGQ